MGIIEDWDVNSADLNEILAYRPSMRGMLVGFVAEYKLTKMLFTDARIHKLTRFDDHDRNRQGDFGFLYQGVPITVEVKSLQSNSIRTRIDPNTGQTEYSGTAQCDASDSKPKLLPSGESLKTTCLVFGGFDLLAVSIFEFGHTWRFAFAKNSDLPFSQYKKYSEEQRKHLIATSIRVTWPLQPPFRDEPFGVLDEIVAIKTKPRPEKKR
jgi:hypothetical protein